MQYGPPEGAWNQFLSGTSAAAATGGAITPYEIKNNSGGKFVCRRMKLVAYQSADGYRVPHLPSPTSASNTAPPDTLITVQVKFGQDNLFNAEVPLSQLNDGNDEGHWFDAVLQEIDNTETIYISGTNNCGASIKLVATFYGWAVPSGTPAIVRAA